MLIDTNLDNNNTTTISFTVKWWWISQYWKWNLGRFTVMLRDKDILCLWGC